MPLGRYVVWMMRHFPGLEIDFDFLIGLGFVFLAGRNEPATSPPRRYTSIRLLSFVGLDSPSTLSLWSC